MRGWIGLVVISLFLLGSTGCMVRSYEPANAEKMLADLEEQYGQRFELVEIEKGGVTVAGRLVPDSLFVKAEDGTYFAYAEHSKDDIRDLYWNMKYGNDYYRNELKSKLDALYGEENYRCQVILFNLVRNSGENKAEKYKDYDYTKDAEVNVYLYLVVRTSVFDLESESMKAADIYNSISNVSDKGLVVGYFSEFPSDIHKFLAYESVGLSDLFSLFYADQMHAELRMTNIRSGLTTSQEEVKALIETNLVGEK